MALPPPPPPPPPPPQVASFLPLPPPPPPPPCRACGHFLAETSENYFFGPPQVATFLPADPELCRLCGCFRLLASSLRQLDPRTGVVRHAFLALEQLILLLHTASSYAAEVQEHRISDDDEWTESPEDAGREPTGPGASSEAEP